NNFARALLACPQSTPLIPVFLDLGFNRITNLIALRPLLYWERIWTVLELIVYRDSVLDILRRPGAATIPWVMHVSNWFSVLGLRRFWEEPHNLERADKTLLKTVYWFHIKSDLVHCTS
ncbi:hypothetical protein NDU88_004450, partial [Pleurodeles waltl]